jgi:hypothetical protein
MKNKLLIGFSIIFIFIIYGMAIKNQKNKIAGFSNNSEFYKNFAPKDTKVSEKNKVDN